MTSPAGGGAYAVPCCFGRDGPADTDRVRLYPLMMSIFDVLCAAEDAKRYDGGGGGAYCGCTSAVATPCEGHTSRTARRGVGASGGSMDAGMIGDGLLFTRCAY